MKHHTSYINCICIVHCDGVMLCLRVMCVSHLLCPLSRQPVQFCESAACFRGCWCKCIKKRERCVCMCVCVCNCNLLFDEWVAVYVYVRVLWMHKRKIYLKKNNKTLSEKVPRENKIKKWDWVPNEAWILCGFLFFKL